MDLISLIIILIVIGVLVFLLNKAPFIDAQYKQIINYVILVVVILWILSLFVDIPHMRIGR